MTANRNIVHSLTRNEWSTTTKYFCNLISRTCQKDFFTLVKKMLIQLCFSVSLQKNSCTKTFGKQFMLVWCLKILCHKLWYNSFSVNVVNVNSLFRIQLELYNAYNDIALILLFSYILCFFFVFVATISYFNIATSHINKDTPYISL